MTDSIEKSHINSFENLKHTSAEDGEFWSARDLQSVFEYSSWEKFENVIEKAKTACNQSKHEIRNHFHQTVKMVVLGSGAKRSVKDYHLSRYACYLIVQNGDPSKPVIANGQTYFAIQTRRKELEDQTAFKELSENQKRLVLRGDLTVRNKKLAITAKDAGVTTSLDYAVFQNHGYKGLYGGLDSQDIHKRKNLKKGQKILDHMGSTELAANLFRATQTDEILQRKNIQNKQDANEIHFKVGSKIRETIKELGGAMPEELPTPIKSIKQLKSKTKYLKAEIHDE